MFLPLMHFQMVLPLSNQQIDQYPPQNHKPLAIFWYFIRNTTIKDNNFKKFKKRLYHSTGALTKHYCKFSTMSNLHLDTMSEWQSVNPKFEFWLRHFPLFSYLLTAMLPKHPTIKRLFSGKITTQKHFVQGMIGLLSDPRGPPLMLIFELSET